MDDSSDYSSDDSSVPTQTKTRKSKVLENILDKLGPADQVSYTPFKCESPQAPIPRLPPSFPLNPRLFDYFSLFFTPDLFKTIN
jgi:hypothetical protein